ncbi:MAG: hypothetical protein HY253_14830 [Burkholderiales bacterium]|nr:hypothetical protein [Burkholderiales bacterium]
MIDKILNLQNRSQTNEVFTLNADNAWPQLNRFADQANALSDDVNTKQVASAASAGSAATSATAASISEANAAAYANAAATVSGATKWVAGNYTDGKAVWSPLNYLTYRKRGDGASATDPALDKDNWASQSVKNNGLTNVQVLNANLLLDQGSAQYQRLTPSASGLDVYLPDARALSTGFDVFKLKSMGAYGLGVRDKSASIIGYLRGYDETVLDLLGNATEAGNWEAQAGKGQLDVADVVKSYGTAGTLSVSNSYAKYRTATLSDALALMVYVPISGNTTVVTIDKATGNSGVPAAAQIDGAAAGTGFALFPLNATQALLVFNNIRMVVLTVNPVDFSISYGAPVTLNTSYGLFYASPVYGTPNLIKLSATTFLTLGGWGGAPRVTCIKITGTQIDQAGIDVAGIPEAWGGYTGWIALSATTALCTYTAASGNTAPYTNYTFVVAVANGVPAPGGVISRPAYNNLWALPLLPYSSTKALQILNDGTGVSARVLTIAGASVAPSAERSIRTDSTGHPGAYTALQSITNTNAYVYSAAAWDIGSFPMGGTYFASQSKPGYLDILNVNFADGTMTVTPQATGAGTAMLTDAGYHLTASYAASNLTLVRLLLSAAGVNALQPTVIPARNATPFSYSVGKSLMYAVGSAPTGSSIAYSILIDDTGALKASANYSGSQSALALRAASGYPLQFSLAGRTWATDTPDNNTASIARLV